MPEALLPEALPEEALLEAPPEEAPGDSLAKRDSAVSASWPARSRHQPGSVAGSPRSLVNA